MKISEFETFDPAKYVDSEAAREALLRDAIESGNADYIANALNIVARAREAKP